MPHSVLDCLKRTDTFLMGKNFKSEQLLLMTLVKNQGATADSILQNQWHIERHFRRVTEDICFESFPNWQT